VQLLLQAHQPHAHHVSGSVFNHHKPFSTIPPLSSVSYTLQLSQPSDQHPLSDPPDAITDRATMLPTRKATVEHLRQLFSKPGPHVSLVGPHVAMECGSADVVADLLRDGGIPHAARN